MPRKWVTWWSWGCRPWTRSSPPRVMAPRCWAWGDKLGTIEAGKLADVIVVAGDPLKDMKVMKRVAVVIKDGVRYK